MRCKSPQQPKTVAIAHENGHKRKKDEFLVMPLKYVPSVMGLANHPGTSKLWAIAPKCRDCHIPCKSPWNPKTMGNCSQNGPKT
jgi:hypothetical protein